MAALAAAPVLQLVCGATWGHNRRVAGTWNQPILRLADLSSVCCTQVTFNPKDSNTFASAALDRTVKVWSSGQPTPNFTLEGHEKGVNAVDYFTGGEHQSSHLSRLCRTSSSQDPAVFAGGSCYLRCCLCAHCVCVLATAQQIEYPARRAMKGNHCNCVTLDYGADM